MPATVFSEAEFSIDCDSIQAMSVWDHPGGWNLLVQLTPEASRDFYHFTKQHLNEVVAVTYSGGVYTRTCVQVVIESGRMTKALPTERAAHDLADAICPAKLKEPDVAEPDWAQDHPALATSPTIALSCADVTEMKLFKGRFALFKDKTGDDFVYLLHIGLTSGAAQRIEQLLQAMEPLFFEFGGAVRSERHVEISVQDRRIRSDAPMRDWFKDNEVSLTFATPKAAMDAAAAVCPQKVPTSIVYPGGQ